jgi:hypothetical protein
MCPKKPITLYLVTDVDDDNVDDGDKYDIARFIPSHVLQFKL